MKRDQRGFMAIWLMGVTMCLVVLVAASFDVWRLIAADRAISAAASAAARAGSQQIDEAHYRATEEVRLDEPRARQVARDELARQPEADQITAFRVTVHDGTRVTVEVAMDVEMGLSNFITGGPVEVGSEHTATAKPVGL